MDRLASLLEDSPHPSQRGGWFGVLFLASSQLHMSCHLGFDYHTPSTLHCRVALWFRFPKPMAGRPFRGSTWCTLLCSHPLNDCFEATVPFQAVQLPPLGQTSKKVNGVPASVCSGCSAHMQGTSTQLWGWVVPTPLLLRGVAWHTLVIHVWLWAWYCIGTRCSIGWKAAFLLMCAVVCSRPPWCSGPP